MDQDIIIVEGKFLEISEKIKKFLQRKKNFEVREEKKKCEYRFFLKSKQNFWLLFLQFPSLQIVRIFVKPYNGKTKIKIKYEFFKTQLFLNYFLFFLLLSLVCVTALAIMFPEKIGLINNFNSNNFIISLSLLVPLLIILFFIFTLKILRDAPINNFSSDLVDSIGKKIFYFQNFYSNPYVKKISPFPFLFFVSFLFFLLTFSQFSLFQVFLLLIFGFTSVLYIIYFRFWKDKTLSRIFYPLFLTSNAFWVSLYLLAPLLWLILKGLEDAPELFTRDNMNLEYMIMILPTFFSYFLIAFLLFLSAVSNIERYLKNFSKFKEDQKFEDALFYISLRSGEKEEKIFQTLTIALWFFTGFFITSGMILEVNCFTYSFLDFTFLPFMKILFSIATGFFYLLTTSISLSYLLTKLFFFLYSLPAIFLIIFVVTKNFRNFLNLKKYSRKIQQSHRLTEIVEKICESLKIPMPTLRILQTSKIVAESTFLIFPKFTNIIFVSNKAIEELSERELEGLLAHELWHVKQHTIRFKLLVILSEWTFMGKGFLVSLLNSVRMEFQADNFAIYWLERRNIPRDIYIKMLRKIEAYNTMVEAKNEISESLGVEEKRKEKNFISRWKMLFRVYLGDEFFWYIYPTIEERIRRIKGQSKYEFSRI